MRTLIIPDIHGRGFWEDAVSSVECDKIVFLGDYLDPYPHEGITRRDTIRNFEDIIAFKKENKEKVILLLGNHDCEYISKIFRRCRFDSSNQYHIREDFLSNKSLFQIAYDEIRDGKRYLYTHAGVMSPWLEDHHNIISKGATVDELNHLLGFKSGIQALGDMSRFRCMFGPWYGSPIWSDVCERDVVNGNLPNTYQIFGHTQQDDDPIITETYACLDVRRAFLLDNDNVIKEQDGTQVQYTNEEHSSEQDSEDA